MADHVVEARLLLRYATYAQWSTSEVILAPGEAAVAIFRYSHNLGYSDSEPENTPPAVGIKIGDGIHYFNELPWVQGIAADVYSWAKAENKPIYTADEIRGLTEFINQHSGGGSGSGSTTDGAYRIIYDNATFKYILQQYNASTGEWENTDSNIDLASILNRIDTIERWANGAQTRLGNIELPLAEYIYAEVLDYLETLDYNVPSVEHQFVTTVTQNNGKISVTRSSISAADITSGILGVERGGTGLNHVEDDEVLVGTDYGTITTKKFVTEMEDAPRSAFATVGAITDFVNVKTAGLTGAMHFVGEATVTIPENSNIDPQIVNYNFRNVAAGDVILANNAQEYVWTGQSWRLLGDEGSYAIKGSIKNADIDEDANIAQSKIADLQDTFDLKVDKVEGKQLSTNDYTNEDKEKLRDIEAGAEVNRIEHIFINNVEEPPAVINQLPKSVAINFIPFTQGEKDKLRDIEAGAQVNKIETISFNNGEPLTPNANKNLNITIDAAALQLSVIEGARYPNPGTNTHTAVDKDPTGKLLELSKVGATGNIDDLLQTQNTYVIFNCGTSTTVI